MHVVTVINLALIRGHTYIYNDYIDGIQLQIENINTLAGPRLIRTGWRQAENVSKNTALLV